jgi:hypothetical protein
MFSIRSVITFFVQVVHCEILKFYDASLLMIFTMEVLNEMATLWLLFWRPRFNKYEYSIGFRIVLITKKM